MKFSILFRVLEVRVSSVHWPQDFLLSFLPLQHSSPPAPLHWGHHEESVQGFREKTRWRDDQVEGSFKYLVLVCQFWSLSSTAAENRKACKCKFWKTYAPPCLFFSFPQTNMWPWVHLYIYSFVKQTWLWLFLSFSLQGTYNLESWVGLLDLRFSFFLLLRMSFVFQSVWQTWCSRVWQTHTEHLGLCTRPHTSAMISPLPLPCRRAYQRARAGTRSLRNNLESSLSTKVSHSCTFKA